jgi:hypothetical protein
VRIQVDSFEYRCWHEVGHATVCLYLGGEVDSIEFLSDDPRGHARTRCVVAPEIHKKVACGGFATEFYLLNNGHAERSPDDQRNISDIVFHNAAIDRLDFWGRTLRDGIEFSKSEDTTFMHCAIGPGGQGGLIPLLHRCFTDMREVVRELHRAQKIQGMRIKELLRLGTAL